MNKFVFSLLISGLIVSFHNAKAEDTAEDAYDKAYSICSEKADLVEGDYEKIFTGCMKSKGFSEDEHDSDSGPAPVKKEEAAKKPAAPKKTAK